MTAPVSRTATRRQMAKQAFAVVLIGGILLIGAALVSDDVASRVGVIDNFLQLYFGGLIGVVAWYWGVGA